MSPAHLEWHKELTKSLMARYGYSEAYCDAMAVIQRNYYPCKVELVPLSTGHLSMHLK